MEKKERESIGLLARTQAQIQKTHWCFFFLIRKIHWCSPFPFHKASDWRISWSWLIFKSQSNMETKNPPIQYAESRHTKIEGKKQSTNRRMGETVRDVEAQNYWDGESEHQYCSGVFTTSVFVYLRNLQTASTSNHIPPGRPQGLASF